MYVTPRALRAPGPPAAVHRRDPRRRDRPGRDRLRRPEREGERARPGHPARRGGRGRLRRRRRGGGRTPAHPAVPKARPHRPAAGHAEVRRQPRRLHRDRGRRLEWISGPESRALVHRWRADSDAVAVGIGTALADDPLLTARDLDAPAPRQPTRVVFDSAARLPLDSALVGSIDRGAAARPRRRRRGRARGRGAAGRGRRGDRAGRRPRPPARRRRSPSSAAARSRRCCSRAAPASPGRCSTRARSTSSALRRAAGARRRRCRSPPAQGPERVADAAKPLAVEWRRSGDDMLASARLREW